MLICTHFSATSIVCEVQEELIGAVTGYINPNEPKRLFIWQVAVDARMRGRGVAQEMISALLASPQLQTVAYIETTISPSNDASQKLFERMSKTLHSTISKKPYFDQKLFGAEAHEDEYLYTIGPLYQSKGD